MIATAARWRVPPVCHWRDFRFDLSGHDRRDSARVLQSEFGRQLEILDRLDPRSESVAVLDFGFESTNKALGLIAMKTCDTPVLALRIGSIWCVAFPPDNIAASRSSISARPDPFQKPIGSGRLEPSISPGIARELAVRIKPAIHGQQLTPHAIRGQSAVRKLRHRHVEHNVSCRPRHRDHQRIVSHTRVRQRPRAEDWAEYWSSRFRSLPHRPPASHSSRLASSGWYSPAPRIPFHCSRANAIARSMQCHGHSDCPARFFRPIAPVARNLSITPVRREYRSDPFRIMATNRGKRFNPCEYTPSRLVSAKS